MLYNPEWKAPKIVEKSLADIYNDAADAIDKHGHSIGKLRDDQGRMCLWGAINYAVHGHAFGGITQASKTLEMVRALSPFTKIDPICWNNDRGRTKEQVVAMLRQAAKML